MSETAWAFQVVSSDSQTDTLEHQATWAQETAAKNGWPITRTFSGVSSGALGTRKLLETLLSELEATPKPQRPKRVLLIRIDRVGREAIECIASLARIRSLGVTLHDSIEGDISLKGWMAAMRPIFSLINAEAENEVRSQKWKAVHARRRAAGLHVGQVPFGVVLVDGRAVPFEPEASLVREIFERAALGWGYARLAAFARERAPKKRRPDGTERAYRWAASTVRTLMDSKTLRSLVVDSDLWERARTARAEDFRARAPKRYPWPLAGAVSCKCGRRLRGHASGVEGYRIRYLVCFDPSHGNPHPAHRADKIEAQFVELLRGISGDPNEFVRVDRAPSLEDLRTRERAARSRIEELERRRQRAWTLAEDGTITAPDLSARLAELESDRRNAERELQECSDGLRQIGDAAKVMESLAEAFADLADIWLEASVEHQNEIARAVGALPEIGGFWCDPARKSVLQWGLSSNERKADDSITKKFIQSITE